MRVGPSVIMAVVRGLSWQHVLHPDGVHHVVTVIPPSREDLRMHLQAMALIESLKPF